LVKCAGRVGRKIIQPDADALCLGKVNVDEFPHAGTEIDGGAAVGDFDMRTDPGRSSGAGTVPAVLR
jgi:hypothetical protein